ISDDAFVREIDDEILRVKEIEQERVKYMTYEMKLEEERELAREEGKIEIVQEMLRAKQPLDFIAKMTKFSSEKISEIGKMYGLL
ncbi:MAG: transposase, partial [Schwartzia sp.]|nr:transposase [Schwartzia sp. (in: firmicutes)]